MTRWLKLLAAVAIALTAPVLVASDPGERILVRTSKPYTPVVASIRSFGGRVTHEFKYVDALAVEIPRSALPALRAIVGEAAITKDLDVARPRPLDLAARKGGPVAIDSGLDVASDAADVLDDAALAQLAGAHPAAYQVNNATANVAGQHAAGFTGLGVTVAVIDGGIRPNFPHISLDGSVVGCEDFVLDGLGCTNAANDGHGTFVAGMISANVAFTFSAASPVRNAILAECPLCFDNAPLNTRVPMIGTAPRSSIYALRVFGPTGGAPFTRILAAVERAIELRERFDAGLPGGANITVCNMSLGGPTLFAGRTLEDAAIDAMLAHGIVPVIAAGNAGPASLTVGMPGTSASAITVGAASIAHNERIWERLMFGPAVGSLYRPFLGVQTAFFSSRGPNADGRPDPDVVANGFGNFSQGYGTAPGAISFGSGTSFATPSVAGVAAVLRQRFPLASALQIRNAIIASANPGILSDGATTLDQGHGYVDAGAAAALLASGSVPAQPGLGPYVSSVKVNIEQNTDLNVRDGMVSETFSNLRPGQRVSIPYRVHPGTKQVIVVLSGVTPELPPQEQNQLFGDDILLAIHTAKTSSIGEGDYPVFAFSTGNVFTIDDPETGLIRVSVNGDWTNAGRVTASVSIYSLTDPVSGKTASGKIRTGQLLAFRVVVPAGTTVADFRLGWREDWGQYPTNDVDLILVRPNGTVDFSGATLNNPEHVAVQTPASGTWLVLVDGFEVASLEDKFDLRVTLDGKVVK